MPSSIVVSTMLTYVVHMKQKKMNGFPVSETGKSTCYKYKILCIMLVYPPLHKMFPLIFRHSVYSLKLVQIHEPQKTIHRRIPELLSGKL